MRVNNFTIAPFVDQKFMAKPDTIKTHSPWIIDIAETQLYNNSQLQFFLVVVEVTRLKIAFNDGPRFKNCVKIS